MKLKLLLIIAVLLYNSIKLYSEDFSGLLIDKETKLPVSYVNIGIIGKKVGTVSEANGKFKINLRNMLDVDSLKISCIGYEHKIFLVNEFKKLYTNNNETIIELKPKTYPKEEITVTPKNIETITVGNFCEADSPYGNAFYSYQLGTEIGVLIKPPPLKKEGFIKDVRFYVGEFTYNIFQVRLNIYNIENGIPNENILRRPVFVIINSTGEYILDIRDYNIKVDNDFFISLEYFSIANKSEGKLIFCAVHNSELYKGNGFFRFTSQDSWHPEIGDNLGLSVQIEYEDQIQFPELLTQ